MNETTIYLHLVEDRFGLYARKTYTIEEEALEARADDGGHILVMDFLLSGDPRGGWTVPITEWA